MLWKILFWFANDFSEIWTKKSRLKNEMESEKFSQKHSLHIILFSLFFESAVFFPPEMYFSEDPNALNADRKENKRRQCSFNSKWLL